MTIFSELIIDVHKFHYHPSYTIVMDCYTEAGHTLCYFVTNQTNYMHFTITSKAGLTENVVDP